MQQPQSWPKPWPKPVTRKDPCEAFEERLTSAIELGKARELLPIFSEYFDWAEENCPTKEDEILNRACSTLLKHLPQYPRYRDSARHLQLWLLHADRLQEPLEVFKLLRSNKVGLGHALFYEALASVQERHRLFSEAETTFREGLSCGAEPRERLQGHFEAFQRRMRTRQRRDDRAQAAKRLRSAEPASSAAAAEAPLQAPVPQQTQLALQPALESTPQPTPQPAPQPTPQPATQPVLAPASLPASPPAKPTSQVEAMLEAPRPLEAAATRLPPLPRTNGTGSRKSSFSGLASCNGSSSGLARSSPAPSGHRDEATQEGMRWLCHGDSRTTFSSPAPSAGSAAFNDPTYTMDMMNKEALACISGDSEPWGLSVAPLPRPPLEPRQPAQPLQEQPPLSASQTASGVSLDEADRVPASTLTSRSEPLAMSTLPALQPAPAMEIHRNESSIDFEQMNQDFEALRMDKTIDFEKVNCDFDAIMDARDQEAAANSGLTPLSAGALQIFEDTGMSFQGQLAMPAAATGPGLGLRSEAGGDPWPGGGPVWSRTYGRSQGSEGCRPLSDRVLLALASSAHFAFHTFVASQRLLHVKASHGQEGCEETGSSSPSCSREPF